MLSASLGSYLVFVNGTPPSERAVGNDRERKKPRPAESLRRREREMMIMMMRKRRTYSISLTARLLPQLRFFFILNEENKIKREMNRGSTYWLSGHLYSPFYSCDLADMVFTCHSLEPFRMHVVELRTRKMKFFVWKACYLKEKHTHSPVIWYRYFCFLSEVAAIKSLV